MNEDEKVKKDEAEEDDSLNEVDSANVGLVVGLVGGLIGVIACVRNLFLKKELKQEREKNLLYQEMLKEHQAIINELKNEKERRAYRDKLWEDLQSQSKSEE